MRVEDKIELYESNHRYALHIDFHQIDDWVALFTVARCWTNGTGFRVP